MKFEKYVAAGNDFIIFQEEDINEIDYTDLAKRVCHRKFGIGADGILVVCKSVVADIKMLYFNSNGTQGEMCGNGIRSFSKYAYNNRLVLKEQIVVETLAGIKNVKLRLDLNNEIENIEVNMGTPIFRGSEIPTKILKEKVLCEKIVLDDELYEFSAVRIGVPHVILFLDDLDISRVDELGRKIENHALFPEKINVNFVSILNKNYIKIYTWERGAGRTLGCGTGSCSAVCLGNELGLLENDVEVKTEGGMLNIKIIGDEIQMVGKANLVAKGEYFI